MSRRWLRRVMLAGGVALALGAGCVRVEVYQRQTLAHPALAAPPWPVLERGQEHVREVREASGGGRGAAGGGCGCN